MPRRKRHWRDRLKISVFSRLGSLVLGAINRTIRPEIRGEERVLELHKEGPVIYGLFHGEHVVPACTGRHHNVCVLTSESRDGEILSRILQKVGIHTVRGSSSHGGAAGVVRLLQAMREGRNPVFAVDGPRGPRHVVKSGVVLLAQKSGRPIIPATSDAEHRLVMRRAWDHFVLPKLFTRALMVYGEPFYVGPEDDIEAKRAEFEQILVQQSYATQYVFGHIDLG